MDIKNIIKGESFIFERKVYVTCLYLGIGNINRLLNIHVEKWVGYISISNTANFWAVL